jgi:cytoskeletal protein RodZ
MVSVTPSTTVLMVVMPGLVGTTVVREMVGVTHLLSLQWVIVWTTVEVIDSTEVTVTKAPEEVGVAEASDETSEPEETAEEPEETADEPEETADEPVSVEIGVSEVNWA